MGVNYKKNCGCFGLLFFSFLYVLVLVYWCIASFGYAGHTIYILEGGYRSFEEGSLGKNFFGLKKKKNGENSLVWFFLIDGGFAKYLMLQYIVVFYIFQPSEKEKKGKGKQRGE